MATNNFVYCSDGLGSRAFDHHSRKGGVGWAYANKNSLQDRTFEHCFQMPGVF